MLPYLPMDMYMFQEVNFELQETDSVQGQVIIQVCFCTKWKFLWLSSFKYFCNLYDKISTSNSLFIAFQSSPYVSINKKIFPFFCNNRKNLFQHEIKNKKKTFMVFDMSYFKLRHVQSHDVSRSILHRQNYLMHYNTDCKPSKILACWWSCKCIRKNHHVAS